MTRLKIAFLTAVMLISIIPLLAFELVTGSPILLHVTVSKLTAKPSETINFTVTSSDEDYEVDEYGYVKNRITDPVTVTTMVSGGSIAKNTTNGNVTTYRWTAPANPGHYIIAFSAADSGKHAVDNPQSKVIEITVKNDLGQTGAANLTLSADSRKVTVSNRNINVTITATLRGKDIAGKRVDFIATGGTISAPFGLTDANGQAIAILTITLNTPVGSITIAGTTDTAVSQTYVQVERGNPNVIAPRPPIGNLPKPPLPNFQPDFLISVNPSSMPADGRTQATVEVRIVDARGFGIMGQQVVFSVLGPIRLNNARALTDRNGFARTSITASSTPTIALIQAQAGAQRSFTEVLCFDPQEEQNQQSTKPVIFLTTSQSVAPADGASKVTVQCLALTEDNYAIPEKRVTFSATAGTLSATNVLTNGSGVASVELTAPNNPADAIVTAQIDGIVAVVRITFEDVNINTGFLPDLEVSMTNNSNLFSENISVVESTVNGGAIRRIVNYIGGDGTLLSYDLGVNGNLLTNSYGKGFGVVKLDESGALTVIKFIDDQEVVAGEYRVPRGLVVKSAYYAEESQNIALLLSTASGVSPLTLLFESGNTSPVLEILSAEIGEMPAIALSSSGIFGVALADGSLRIYDSAGEKITEGAAPNVEQRVVAVRFTPNNDRFIVVTEAPLGNTVLVYRADTLALTHTINSIPITYIGTADNGLMISGNDGYGRFYNFSLGRFVWQVFGNVTSFMAEDGGALMSIIQSQNPQDTIIAIALLSDGTILRSQSFPELGKVISFMKANQYGKYGVIVSDRIMRFLP